MAAGQIKSDTDDIARFSEGNASLFPSSTVEHPNAGYPSGYG